MSTERGQGHPPLELLERGREEVRRYGGVIRTGEVSALDPAENGPVRVALSGGASELSRRVILATGLRDELPAVEGLAERWGTGVAVCPYCDGWEVRDGRIGILATSPGSVFQAQLLRQWSANIIYLENGTGEPTADAADALAARGIEVRMGAVREVLSNAGGVSGVRLASGEVVTLDGIFTVPRSRPFDDVLRDLGAARADMPQGSFVQVDGFGRTSVPGVWAVGNVVDPNASLAVSIGDAARAAGMLNHELILDDIQQAVQASVHL